MGRKITFIILGIVLILISGITSRATEFDEEDTKETNQEDMIDEIANDVDYQDVQQVVDELLSETDSVNFEEYVKELVSGETEFSLDGILSKLKDVVLGEFKLNSKTIFQLIAIAIIAAVFTNFSNVFRNNQVAETGFYVTYLFLFSILTTSFYLATSIAVSVISSVLTFMKVLLPTYMLSIAFSAGTRTSMFYYESILFVIALVDFILIKVVLPLINIYFVLVLANNLSKEDMLSKFTELIEMIVQWILKSLMAVVIGFNAVQGLIVPMAEHVKNSVILKSTSAIPGIGNTINSVTETVLGAGVVVKNAIGVVGLIVILAICIVPIVKLALYVIIYKFGVSIVQPISDKRILNCMNASANAAKLLLNTVVIAAILFLVSIAVIAASTNLRV